MHTNFNIRPATASDLPQVLRLNEAAIPHVSTLTSDKLRALFDEAAWFRLVVADGRCAGFLIALLHNATYSSENYLWFAQRFANFLYIDRICVSPEFQRWGIASRLYANVENYACEACLPILACEINLEPENPTSLDFHDKRGFEEIGTQRTEAGTKLVSLRVKRLHSDRANRHTQTPL